MTRYLMRTLAFIFLLTPAYPKGLFGDRGRAELGRAAKTVVAAAIVVGIGMEAVTIWYAAKIGSGPSYEMTRSG